MQTSSGRSGSMITSIDWLRPLILIQSPPSTAYLETLLSPWLERLNLPSLEVCHPPHDLPNNFGLCTTLALAPNRERILHLFINGTVTAESHVSKANLLNCLFSSCFSPQSPSSIEHHPDLSNTECSEEEVGRLLCSLKTKTSTGPDGISSHMLRNTAHSISTSLCNLFNRSLSSGCFPAEWKCSNVTPVFKAGDKSLVSNYRPISLLSIPSKILERIVHRRLLQHLISNSILSPWQFGFRPHSSTQEALLTATHD